MHDDQIRDLLRTFDEARDPDRAFADALFARLERVVRSPSPRRSPFILLAAALLLATLVAALAVGWGLIPLPMVVDPSASPNASASELAVASSSATPMASTEPEPSRSAPASSTPEPVELAGAVLTAAADGLRLRTEPSGSSEVVATLRRGQLMGTTGVMQSAEGMVWYEIRIGPGERAGWVAGGPDDEWLWLVEDGALAFSCGGCVDPAADPQQQDPVLVSVTPFGDSAITAVADDLTGWTWSPDGSLLAGTAREDAGTSVVVMRPDGSERREIGPDGYGVRWSPDGRLAWTTGSAVIVTDAALEPLGAGVALRSAGMPFWSPDGLRLAVIALDCPECPADEPIVGDVPQAAYIIDLATSEVTKITDPGYYDLAGWSPDGTRLSMSEVDLSGERPSQAFTIESDGGGGDLLLDGAAVHGAAYWSPDGTRLAMATPDGIVVANGDGTAASVLAAGGSAFFGDVQWSPGGRWLTYTSSVGPQVAIWIVAADGSSTPRQISPATASAGNAAWQPTVVRLP